MCESCEWSGLKVFESMIKRSVWLGFWDPKSDDFDVILFFVGGIGETVHISFQLPR